MHRIICPHCQKDLSISDIAFESILTNVSAKPDEVKFMHLKRFRSSIEPGDLSCMSRSIARYSPKDDSFDMDPQSGTPIAWREIYQGNTYTSRSRVCRHCHMPLPVKAGLQKMLSIGFVGNSGAGKTVYLLSLIHDLSSKIRGFSLTPDPAFFSTVGNAYKQLYQDMYEPQPIVRETAANPSFDLGFSYLSGTEPMAAPIYSSTAHRDEEVEYAPYYLPPATSVADRLMPIVLNCSYQGQSFMLAMFDMAGEGVRNELYLETSGEYLKYVDGVIYLKDPEYLPILGTRGNVLVEHEYLDRIVQSINKDAYIGITMTKFDMLERRRGQTYDRIMVNSFLNNGVNPHQNGFNEADVRLMNQRLIKLYGEPEYFDSIILNTYLSGSTPQKAKRRCLWFGAKRPAVSTITEDRIMMFAASALGVHAHVQQERDGNRRNYVTVCPAGVRNTDPIMWILNKNDLFPAAAGGR